MSTVPTPHFCNELIVIIDDIALHHLDEAARARVVSSILQSQDSRLLCLLSNQTFSLLERLFKDLIPRIGHILGAGGSQAIDLMTMVLDFLGLSRENQDLAVEEQDEAISEEDELRELEIDMDDPINETEEMTGVEVKLEDEEEGQEEDSEEDEDFEEYEDRTDGTYVFQEDEDDEEDLWWRRSRRTNQAGRRTHNVIIGRIS